MTRPLVWKHLSRPRPGAAASIIAIAPLGAAGLAALDGGFGDRSWALVAGVVFGIALQRGELSLVRAWRDLTVLRDSSQLLGFVAALSVAAALTLGTVAALGLGRPVNARIGPVDWLLPVSALVFGVGSVIARGGMMVHLRRIGEGSLIAAPALIATFIGFMAAISHWTWTWEVAMADAPAPWLPDRLGASATIALELAVLSAFAAALWRFRPAPDGERPRGLGARIFVEPWPAWAAGSLLGALVAASYAVGEPLGLIAECATMARWLATLIGLAPIALPGLDAGVAGLKAPLIRGFALTEHVIIVAGFVLGAFACAVASGRFAIEGFTRREALEMTVGGLMLGWGAMTALGAVTGEAIAGVAVGAASGWIFLAFASLGIVTALRFDRRTAMTAPAPEPVDAR